MRAEQPLPIESIEELFKHQEEILARIERVPNGGNLFVVHPLQMLADVGVQLSPAVREELLRRSPQLAAASPVAYEAVRSGDKDQKVRVHLRPHKGAPRL
jgi:hypothetical protein